MAAVRIKAAKEKSASGSNLAAHPALERRSRYVAAKV
jgi:hypothetical protein